MIRLLARRQHNRGKESVNRPSRAHSGTHNALRARGLSQISRSGSAQFSACIPAPEGEFGISGRFGGIARWWPPSGKPLYGLLMRLVFSSQLEKGTIRAATQVNW
jgi:hypothetical protein